MTIFTLNLKNYKWTTKKVKICSNQLIYLILKSRQFNAEIDFVQKLGDNWISWGIGMTTLGA